MEPGGPLSMFLRNKTMLQSRAAAGEPTYVNTKQCSRILKMRDKRLRKESNIISQRKLILYNTKTGSEYARGKANFSAPNRIGVKSRKKCTSR